MQIKDESNILTVDLKNSSQEEVSDFIRDLLAARHSLIKKGYNLKIRRRRPRLRPLTVNKSSQG